MDVQKMIHAGLDAWTPDRRAFLRKAFRMLPPCDRPRVLDLGCGHGAPTLELARLSGGAITAVDIDAEALADLEAHAKQAGLSDQIQIRTCSMDSLDLPDRSFDILWSEGSVHAIGFEKALTDWRRLLRSAGYLVIHESAWLRPHPPEELVTCWAPRFPCIRTVGEYAAVAPRYGYSILEAFALPKDFWWENYYRPLKRRLEALHRELPRNPEALAALAAYQREIGLYKRHKEWFGSAYLVMQSNIA